MKKIKQYLGTCSDEELRVWAERCEWLSDADDDEVRGMARKALGVARDERCAREFLRALHGNTQQVESLLLGRWEPLPPRRPRPQRLARDAVGDEVEVVDAGDGRLILLWGGRQPSVLPAGDIANRLFDLVERSPAPEIHAGAGESPAEGITALSGEPDLPGLRVHHPITVEVEPRFCGRR